MNNILIYDFETLSQDMINGVVVSLAALNYDESRFTEDSYTFEELVNSCGYIKFDVAEQVEKYKRTIQKSTLDWWKQQSAEARKAIQPSSEDVSIDKLYEFLVEKHQAPKMKTIFTRGNTFDPIFARTIFTATGYTDPTPWWTIRDTRSFLDGLTYGSGISDKFIPDDIKDKVIQHDPRHDIALDVYRMQTVIRVVKDCD